MTILAFLAVLVQHAASSPDSFQEPSSAVGTRDGEDTHGKQQTQAPTTARMP